MLLATGAPEKLTRAARKAVESGANVLSVVVYWEVVLKSAKGKLHVGDPREWWETALSDLAATSIPLRPRHIAEIHSLQTIHQDPFDRALIAQAIIETLPFVTTDAIIGQYASERFNVVH